MYKINHPLINNFINKTSHSFLNLCLSFYRYPPLNVKPIRNQIFESSTKFIFKTYLRLTSHYFVIMFGQFCCIVSRITITLNLRSMLWKPVIHLCSFITKNHLEKWEVIIWKLKKLKYWKTNLIILLLKKVFRMSNHPSIL